MWLYDYWSWYGVSLHIYIYIYIYTVVCMFPIIHYVNMCDGCDDIFVLIITVQANKTIDLGMVALP